MNDLSGDGYFERTVAPALAEWLGVAPGALKTVNSVVRRYSSLWTVAVGQGGGSTKFYVKAGQRKAEREYALSRRANELLGGRTDFVPLRIHFDSSNGLLFIGEVPGGSLESLTTTFVSRPLAWYPEMRRAFTAAGTWLRAYHDLGRSRRSVSDPLLAYVARREVQLARLTPASRERVFALIRSVGEAEVTTVHSDFSPGNLIWDGSRLGVIDYGINEWLTMSPWWDVLTFGVIMERNLALNWRTPMPFLPAARKRLLRAFLSAYGAPAAHDRAWYACAAVRHLSLMSGVKAGESTINPATAWHLRRLEHILEASGVG